MQILFEHAEYLPVTHYGGAERILFWHMKELARRGHEVTLIGHSKSQVQSHNIRLISRQEKDWRHHIPKEVDIIHLFYTPCLELNHPLLVSIGGNGKPGETFHSNTVFTSKKHAENHGSTHFIYNGLDFTEYPYLPRTQSQWQNFIFLAKAKWKVKNLSHCILACRRRRKDLHIAGGRAWACSRWIHSYGMVSQEQKISLLQSVDALLFPVRWHEPFGIAIIEAFAMGLPVIASSYGSLPELIPSFAGRICSHYEEFESIVGDLKDQLNSEKIRQYAVENFSIQVMTDRYLKYYEQIIAGETLSSPPPQALFSQSAEKLLPF